MTLKPYKKIFINLLVLSIILVPLIGFAQGQPEAGDKGLVPCTEGKQCNLNMLMLLIDNIIKFIILKLAVPIAAIMFAYAGFLLITSGGESSEAKSKAKGIFLNTLLGLLIVLGAWLIISTILAILGYDGSWIGLKVGL